MRKLQMLFIIACMAVAAVSCSETSISHEGPARLVLENLTTGTEAIFDGTFLDGEPEPLVIRNNDSLQVLFVPEQNYVKYGFEATFTLPDNKVIVDKEYPFIYKMLVRDLAPGTYTITCEATVESSEAEIYEKGEAKIVVMQ